MEILGRGHSVVIDDFSAVVVDARTERLGGQDKGHRGLLGFPNRRAWGGDEAVTLDAVASSRTTLEAVGSLGVS